MLGISLIILSSSIFLSILCFTVFKDKNVRIEYKLVIAILCVLYITIFSPFTINSFNQYQLQTAYYNGVQIKVKIKYDNNQIVKQDTTFYIK